MERARRLHHCGNEKGATYITVIDAQKLSRKIWKFLRMADELQRYRLGLDDYNVGLP